MVENPLDRHLVLGSQSPDGLAVKEVNENSRLDESVRRRGVHFWRTCWWLGRSIERLSSGHYFQNDRHVLPAKVRPLKGSELEDEGAIPS
jgi:hypothetical protein